MNGPSEILIRFNTKWTEDTEERKWRLLVDGKEVLAHAVVFEVPGYTIEREVDGERKWHIMYLGYLHHVGDHVYTIVDTVPDS